MISRISDQRVLGADAELALIIDLLKACRTGGDLGFMFPELSRPTPTTLRIPVDTLRALRFEWVEEFGAINIRLE